MTKRWLVVLGILLILAIPLGVSAPDGEHKFTPKAKQNRELGGKHTYIVELEEGPARSERGFTDGSGCEEKYLSSSSGFAVLECDSPAINKVAAKSKVHKIYDNEILQPLLDSTVPSIHATDAWYNFSVNGSGIVIAIVDSGINDSHPAFNGTILAQYDFTNELTTLDLKNHGTAVASVAVSQDTSRRGVAPGAQILNAKACTTAGCAFEWIVSATDWAIEQGADVISYSFGSSTGSCANSVTAIYVNSTIEETGIPFTISVGNAGPGNETIATPACAENTIGVGGNEGNDIATLSSRGPVNGANIKPDVVAPVTATMANAWGQWQSMTGTSISTPHVSGVVALMLDARPELIGKWRIIKHVLKASADDLGYQLHEQGAGRVNALRAVNLSLIVDARDPFVNWTLSETHPTPATKNNEFNVNFTALNTGNQNATNVNATISGFSDTLKLKNGVPESYLFSTVLTNASIQPGWIFKSTKTGSWILTIKLTSDQKNATISFNQSVV